MTIDQAVQLIQKGIPANSHTWADLGAGTGNFTLALKHILPGARILSVDKNPHALYNLQRSESWLEIIEGDFTKVLDLPDLDGVIMANALHYVSDPVVIMPLILSYLKPGGRLILIEYDINVPVRTWIPYPVPFDNFIKIAQECQLGTPQLIGTKASIYGRGQIYAAVSVKL